MIVLHPLRNWLSRHKNPTNFWLHMLGIPATVAGVGVAVAGLWVLGVGVFVAGYALQFIGHAAEGNSPGEAMLVRRILRRGRLDRPSKP